MVLSSEKAADVKFQFGPTEVTCSQSDLVYLASLDLCGKGGKRTTSWPEEGREGMAELTPTADGPAAVLRELNPWVGPGYHVLDNQQKFQNNYLC